LLPIAAPIAILATQACPKPVLIAGLALQLILSLGLAIVNYQHWGAYRDFAANTAPDRRVWINSEWGLRFYLESRGALPMARDQVLQPGDIVVSSALALPIEMHASTAALAQIEIRPAIPLRIVSLDGRSAYSSASPRGLLPFEISHAPIDVVRSEIVLDRKPELSFIDPRDPKAGAQILGGLSSDGWTGGEATVLLKPPDRDTPLRVEFHIPQSAPARHVKMMVDGQVIAEETYSTTGSFSLIAPFSAKTPDVSVTLSVDRTFSVPGDHRRLGVIVTGIGFR
jgi:hypothetical protein